MKGEKGEGAPMVGHCLPLCKHKGSPDIASMCNDQVGKLRSARGPTGTSSSRVSDACVSTVAPPLSDR